MLRHTLPSRYSRRSLSPRRSIVEVSQLESRRLMCLAHEAGSFGYVDEAASLARGPVTADSIDQLNVPAFSSRPAATKKLYIDFNGHSSFDNWSGWWEFGGYTAGPTQAYDIDSDGSSYSYQERQNIEKIWKGVAEKFSPFDLDVTTVKPASLSPGKTAIVIVGGDGSWLGHGGGVAQVNGFNEGFFDGNYGNYGFVWGHPDNPAYVAESIAHEAGHMFNLYHQSLPPIATNEYADGFIMGDGDAFDFGRWANTAISGTQATSKDGDSVVVARSSQDDLAILSGTGNGFGYRADDFGNTTGAATTLTLASVNGVLTASTSGVITTTSDSDVIRIVHGGGSFEAEVLSGEFRKMLDPQLGLLNSGGFFVENSNTDDGADGSGEKISFNNLAAGTYFLTISSEGGYGNVGQWRLNVRAGTGSTTPNNTLGTALNIGLQGDTVNSFSLNYGFMGNATIAESVQSTDTFDFFRVKMAPNVRSFFAQLSGMTTSTDMAIVSDLNGNGLIDAGETIASSLGGTGTQTLSLTSNLAAGDVLYVRTRNVGGGNSNYTLKLSADSAPATLPASVPNSFFDPAPYHGGTTVYDAIMPAAGDTVDYFRLKPDFAGTLSVYLFETGGNVVFTVGNDVNANGVIDASEFLISSGNTNDFVDIINVNANANILIKVTGSVEANYNVFAMMDYPNAGNQTGTLTGGFVVPAGNTGTFRDYLGFGLDAYDTYKFNPVAGLFHAKLSMVEALPAHRLQIIQDANTNGVADAGEIVADGFGELTFNITTFADYYMRVVPAIVGEFGTTGNYHLAWWMGNSVEPPGAPTPNITPGSSNQTVNGYLGVNANEALLNDTEDRFNFTIAARTRFDVSINNPLFGLQILQGTTRIAGLPTNVGTIGSLSVNLDPGTYTLRAYLPTGQGADDNSSFGGDYTMTYKTAAVTDNTRPTVTSSGFQYEVKATGVYFVMSEDVAGSVDLADASVLGLDNGFLFPLRATHYDPATRTAGFEFTSPVLPDGHYRATLAAGSVKDPANNTLASAFTFDFNVLSGDFNRDGTVGFDDLLLLTQNYGAIDAGTFGKGDINYNRNIDFDDLLLFAQKYGNHLFSAAPINGASDPKPQRFFEDDDSATLV